MNQSKPVLVSDTPSNVLALDDEKYSRLGWLLVLGGFAGFLGWAALAPLDKGVAVPGKVMVSGHRKTVQHPAGALSSVSTCATVTWLARARCCCA